MCARQQIFIEQLLCASQGGYDDVMVAEKECVAVKQLGNDDITWRGKYRNLREHKGVSNPVLGSGKTSQK